MRSYRNWAVFTLLICCLVLSASMAQCKTVYVSQSAGADTNDGLSWGTAKATVTVGIAAALAGDEVWVAKGTYVERITVSRSIGLYGGFVGTETTRDQRDWKANQTILDGNKQGTVVTLSAAGAVLDGFVVRNGRSGTGPGGVSAYPSTIVSNNLIIGNSLIGTLNYSGGVRCNGARVLNNIIRGNYSPGYGGGVSVLGASEVVGNAILDNSASGAAAVYITGSPSITNNTIVGNVGSTIICASSSTPKLSNNIIAHNSSGIVSLGAAPVLRNNCVYNPDGVDYTWMTAGTGDISVDPKLGGYRNGDWHIQPDSPCRDAGWNDAPAQASSDIDGQARIQPARGTIDIGADESDGTSWSTDPVVIRVSPSGDDLNDGSTWAAAKKTIQAGMNALVWTSGEVWVAAGTYHERITIPGCAYLYGGFAGTETTKALRNRRTNVSIIDGDSLGAAVTFPCSGYLRAAIDGFTIQHGKAGYGGGLYCTYSAPYVTNNVIRDNEASHGGGIYGDSGSILRVINNAFLCNAGNAAISIGPAYQFVVNNTILGSGTGIYCGSGNTNAVIENNIIAFSSVAGINVYQFTGVLKNNCLFNPSSVDYLGLPSATTSMPGDVLADPKISGWRAGGYHIQPDSPCVDAGANDAPGLAPDDIDGQPRIQPTGSRVDIGADESDGTWFTVNVAVVRVSPDGNDANDGSSWGLAKKTIQAGVNAAMAFNGEVWVKAGTYKEHIIPNYTSPLPNGMPSVVYLYGGFTGAQTTRDTRDWKANATIVDGEKSGTVVTTFNNGNWLGAVDGFTIRNGYASTGAGINCGSCTEIANNTITKNQASGNGGGIYLSQSGNPYSIVPIINNRILDNGASNGGGIYSYGQALKLAGNTIARNGLGGVHFATQSSGAPPSTICNNAFVSNTGAAVKLLGSTTSTAQPIITITNNTILNSSTYGIQITGGNGFSLPISNNIIAFNSTGVYYNVSLSPSGLVTLRNNCFYNPGGADSFIVSLDATDIKADPKLAEGWWTGDSPAHIQPDSPCRDAGWNDAPDVPSMDVDGQPRIQPAGGRIDIGADESDGTIWPWRSDPNPVTICVSLSGDNRNDGSSWTLAKRTVQAGIDAAAPSGGNVWVAAGTYQERISLKPLVHIYGGFTGTEAALRERPAFPRHSPDPAETTLDGEKQGTVVTFMRLGGDCGIDGFTITNGVGDLHSNASNDFCGTDGPVPCGGGILCDTSSPVIANNTVAGNNASYGAGIYLSNSSALITDNRITDNQQPSSRGFGGGLYSCVGAPVIRQNTISDNFGGLDGAGMCLWRCTGAVLDSNQITGNTSAYNGGGMTAVLTNATITRNTFAGNSAANVGGGMDLGLGGTSTVTGNVVRNNKAKYGAGVWMDAIPLVTNTQFGTLTVSLTSNTIVRSDGRGIDCSNNPKGFIANSIVAFNTSGISSPGTAMTVRNNDVYTPNQPMTLPDNISADPLFVGLASGNYHLTAASPCINAGWNDAPGIPALDFDGQKRIQGGTVDIGADEWWPGAGDAKKIASGSIGLSAITISAAFPDFFYVENDDRSAGIRVDKPGHGLAAGVRVDVDGTPGTNADGERIITASSVTLSGFGSVVPLAVSNKTLGGGPFGLQQALWGWVPVKQPDQTMKPEWLPSTGLNNVGLLIKTWGRVTYSGDGFFYIDDGSALDDNSGHRGVKVYGGVPVAPGVDPVGRQVFVTGISSCEKPGSDPVRIIRTRGAEDVSLAGE